ncbi:tetratricopeptide repeat protein [Streptomyces bottropensis]|uniref:tetratricopeptide repeat protein n=1 Tax=Streptomyces bottropensis TaxID=42235 RepID=UPI00368BA119
MDNPIAQLAAFLRRLRLEAGDPSTREIAKMTGSAISHTAVHQLLAGRRAGRWGPVEVVVEALGGDATEARNLWRRARQYENETRRETDDSSDRTPRKNYTPADARSYTWAYTYAVHSVANRHFENKEFKLALDLIESEIERSSKRYCTPVHMLFVQIQLAQKDPDGKLDKFADNCKLLEVYDPEVADYFASDVYAEVNDFESAVRFGREAVRLDPENANYHWRLGLYLSDLGADKKEILEHFRRAHRANPSDGDYAASLMGVLIMEGFHSEAEAVGRSFRPDPSVRPGFYWEVPYYLGQALALQGKLEEAAEVLRENAEKGDIHVALERARILYHAGDVNAALAQLKKEWRSKDAGHAAKVESVRILKELGRNEEAAKVLDELAQALNNPEAWDHWR